MSGETILIIDDDATLRELLAAQLHTAGYRTREAANGSIGLKLAAEFAPGNGAVSMERFLKARD